MTDPVSRSQLEEAREELMHGKHLGASSRATAIDTFQAVLSAPTVRWCKAHQSGVRRRVGSFDFTVCDWWLYFEETEGTPPEGACKLTTVALVPMEDGK